MTSKEILAISLLLWRALYNSYIVGQEQAKITFLNEAAAYRGIAIAKEFGFFPEYWKWMQELPAISVMCKDLEEKGVCLPPKYSKKRDYSSRVRRKRKDK